MRPGHPRQCPAHHGLRYAVVNGEIAHALAGRTPGPSFDDGYVGQLGLPVAGSLQARARAVTGAAVPTTSTESRVFLRVSVTSRAMRLVTLIGTLICPAGMLFGGDLLQVMGVDAPG